MVSDDVILEQVEYTYDSAGNVIQTVVRQRYHNAPDTQQGSLQNPSTTPKARVLYRASWPDGIGRMIATATYGTNGGTSLSRPSTVRFGYDSGQPHEVRWCRKHSRHDRPGRDGDTVRV
jgi:hypothetical protein